MSIFISLFDSFFRGSLLYIFFQTILGKKAKLPFYWTIFIYTCSYIIHGIITNELSGNTTIFATLIRLSITILLIFSLSLLFKSNIKTYIFVTISCAILITISEELSYYFISNILSFDFSGKTMDKLIFSSISLSSNLFMFIFTMLLHLFWKKQAQIHSATYTIFMLVVPLLSLCLIMSRPFFYLNVTMPMTYFLLVSFLLFINIANYLLLQNVLHTEELQSEIKILSEQMEYQRNKYQQLGEAYKNIRSFMHDTKKHLFYIEKCVNEEKYAEIIPYSRDIMCDLESRYCTINTGNLVIDAFVSNLLLQTKTQGITLHTNLKFDKTTIPVNDYHLTIILGNLLDNALNACKDQIGAQIKVAVRTVDGTFTIHVANTYVITDSANAPSDFENIDFIHGYGLKNVKDSAAACGGFCVIQHENDVYSATVIIPILSPDKIHKF